MFDKGGQSGSLVTMWNDVLLSSQIETTMMPSITSTDTNELANSEQNKRASASVAALP